nr:hypothetical protein Itr_chr04CG13210 [Ipomoea trifida]
MLPVRFSWAEASTAADWWTAVHNSQARSEVEAGKEIQAKLVHDPFNEAGTLVRPVIRSDSG